MSRFLKCLPLFFLPFALNGSPRPGMVTEPWEKEVGATRLPASGKVFLVDDFGAKAGGKMATTSIQNAIDACAAAGGGTVSFKPGVYLTGSLFLKKGVTFKVDKGTELRGSTQIADYPEIDTRIAGIEMKWPAALLNVLDQRGVAVTGDGLINAQGKVFWDAYWNLRKIYEPKGLRWIVDYDAKRPRTLLISRSQDVTVKGLTLQEAGFWTVQVLYSTHVTVDGITVRNNVNGHGPSTDGIDIDSSTFVLVENCDIDCNDDNFCLKAGRDWDGQRVNRPTEYIVIRRCKAGAGAGLLTMGSETAGSIRHVHAYDLHGKGTTNGLNIKSSLTRGGTVEDIRFERITMDQVGTVLQVSMNWNPNYSFVSLPSGYDSSSIPPHWKKMLHPVPAEKGIPHFRQITLNNVTAGRAGSAINASGLPASLLEDFTLNRVNVSCETAGKIKDAKNWKVTNSSFRAKDGSKLDFPVDIGATSSAILGANSLTSWPPIEKQAKPWTRWWWMGSAVDSAGIARQLSEFADAGIGGVEITPIYGAKGYESRYLDFLSPSWMKMLRFTVAKAQSVKMGVDMNTGTGWPFGGPQIKPEYAASKLIFKKFDLNSGQVVSQKLTLPQEALVATERGGKKIDLRNKVDSAGRLIWTAPGGHWTVYAASLGKTGQMVKRAAPGGIGFSLDHLSSSAVDRYLLRFDEAFVEEGPAVRCFFNDSYEVYGANWSSGFLTDFQKIQGYDLALHIAELSGEGSADSVARVKSDYREVMSKMLLTHFTDRWSNWAHKYQSLSRNQSHGSPGNLLDLYGAVDIPECETYGSRPYAIPGLRRDADAILKPEPDPLMMKFASSAAHVAGKPLTSCETFTWLGDHFRTAWSQCKPEVEAVFLTGVNHVFFHGSTYSPNDVSWPGWLFYASMNFVPSNSLWPHLRGLTSYITRCQSVLQEGKADNELLLYWPVYDVWNNAEGLDLPLQIHTIDKWLIPSAFYRAAKKLTVTGFSVDYVSDKVLNLTKASPEGLACFSGDSSHRVLVVPACRLMPDTTLENIVRLIASGARVIFEALPADVPGLARLAERRAHFKNILAKLQFIEEGSLKVARLGSGMAIIDSTLTAGLALSGLDREKLCDAGLKFIRRSNHNQKSYFLVNHTQEKIATWLPLAARFSRAALLDPLDGSAREAQVRKASSAESGRYTSVFVELASGSSLFVRTEGETSRSIPMPPRSPALKAGKPILIAGPWSLHLTRAGGRYDRKQLIEPLQSQTLKQLVSWTDLADTNARSVSGTGSYRCSFSLDNSAKEYVLSLGDVRESARVLVNGKDAGILWCLPFEVKIGKLLKKGINTLQIDVVNTMLNQIKLVDRLGSNWKSYHEIGLVDIHYKPYDATKQAYMPSGLLGPVRITPYN